jgi:hypothetical protein
MVILKMLRVGKVDKRRPFIAKPNMLVHRMGDCPKWTKRPTESAAGAINQLDE